MDSEKVNQASVPPGDALFSDSPHEAHYLAAQAREIEYNRHRQGEVQFVRCGGGRRIIRKRLGD